jgi:uracil-DNA glycosylase
MIPVARSAVTVCALSHYPRSGLANTENTGLGRPSSGVPSPPVRTAAERRELLKDVYEEARGCTRCPLHQTRTTVVFGAGNADADLMFIGEAPGANEDRLGLPFVGQAGKLLDKLLAEIGLDRKDVWICNVLKCRPPNNRDPNPNEIEACSDYLRRQVDLIEPTAICTLGNFSTKLLRDDTTGISRLHGREEVRIIGPRAVRLYPLYHPAAALYTPSMLEALRADFHRIPELLALGPPEQPQRCEPVPDLEELTDEESGEESGGDQDRSAGREPEPAAQLGLF